MTRKLALLALAAALAACGVPEAKFNAARDAEDRALKEARDAEERAKALEAKLKEVEARQAQLEKARSSALADAEAQRQAAGQLEKSKAELEAEKAAAAAEAERQRKLAGELARTAKELEAEKASATTEAERQRQLAERLAAEKADLAADLEKRSADYRSLASSLSDEIKAGRVQVSELQGKLTVRMAERVLFPTGSATISRDGQGTLKVVAKGLQAVRGRIIRVEGHTDNVPIHNDRFPSNWELSAGRAIAVVRFLQAQGIEPGRLGAAGYAEYQPIASNDTAEGKALNRRIEISLALPPSAVPEAGAAAK
jgi:chemotaxis protein MotB